MNQKFWSLAVFLGFATASLAATSCDPNAKANSNDRTLFAKDRLSKMYESCSATSDCAEELRCLERTCVATTASVVGDYHAAVGARALAAGDIQRATDAYEAAVNRYKSDSDGQVPTHVNCAYGNALTAASGDPQMAEGAARALDQCLRGSPVGSALRHQALQQLAILGDAGLDPEHLGSGEPPPRYMTKAPSRPATDKLQVQATGDARKKVKTYNEFLALIASPNSKGGLVPCWEQNWKATKEDSLTVALSFRNKFFEGEYEEDDRYRIGAVDPAPTAGSAQKCVYDVLVTLAEEYSKTRRPGPSWTAKITVTISQ